MKGDGTDDLGRLLKTTLRRKLAEAYNEIRDLKNGEFQRTRDLRAELDSAKYMIEVARRERDVRAAVKYFKVYLDDPTKHHKPARRGEALRAMLMDMRDRLDLELHAWGGSDAG